MTPAADTASMTTSPAPATAHLSAVDALRERGFVLVTGPLGTNRREYARWLAAAAGLPETTVRDPFWAATPADIAPSGPVVLVDALVGVGSGDLAEQVGRLSRIRPVDAVVDLTGDPTSGSPGRVSPGRGA